MLGAVRLAAGTSEMRTGQHVLLLGLLLPFLCCADEAEEEATDIDYAVASLLKAPFEEIRDAERVTVQQLADEDRKAVLERLGELPKLSRLTFIDCDLSGVDETHPIPARVETLEILGGNKLSQGTINWVAKFPRGVGLWVGSDVSGLDLDLGKSKAVTFEHCAVPRSAVAKLVEDHEHVTFEGVTLADG
jgi:hypothetical protein